MLVFVCLCSVRNVLLRIFTTPLMAFIRLASGQSTLLDSSIVLPGWFVLRWRDLLLFGILSCHADRFGDGCKECCRMRSWGFSCSISDSESAATRSALFCQNYARLGCETEILTVIYRETYCVRIPNCCLVVYWGSSSVRLFRNFVSASAETNLPFPKASTTK